MRLNKFISETGVCSRRQADDWIAAGRVTVNGEVAVLGTRVEPMFQPPRAGDVRDSLADISRTREVLGYEPEIGFTEGLKRTVEYYRGQ